MEEDDLTLFPKEYQKALVKFDKSWTKNHNNPKKLNSLMHAFCDKYTTCTGFWHMWINLIRYYTLFGGESKYFTKTPKEIEIDSLKHYPGQLTDEWPSLDKKFFSDPKRSSKEKLEYAEFLLSLPHSKLSLALSTWNGLTTKSTAEPKNINLYHKNVEVFKEMHFANIHDGDKYIEILKKGESEEFVIKNIECQLAKKSWCKNLWIAYIQFLENETKDKKALLSVLQRYCRFFVNDKKMKEKYQSKIEECSQSMDGFSKFWIDSIKFELQFNGKAAAMAMVEKALVSNMKDFPQFLRYALAFVRKYTLKNIEEKIVAVKEQYPLEIDEYDYQRVVSNLSFDSAPTMPIFPFSDAVNYYISKNLDYPHLRKLYQTCKWLYFKYRLNLVHKLEIVKKSYAALGDTFSCNVPYLEFLDDSVAFSQCKIESINLKNLWLTNALYINDCQNVHHLFNLMKNEFEILTKSKTIVSLELQYHTIKDENDENIVVEDVLKNVPNARQIKIQPAYLTPKTAETLLSLNFFNKFDFIDISFNPQINAALYYEFLENNVKNKAQVCLYCFTDDMDYKNAMKQYFSKWHPKNQTPNLEWQEHRV